MQALQTLKAKAGTGGRRAGVAAAVALALGVGLLGSAPAFADDDGWRHHHRHGYWGPQAGVYYGAPAYAPPPPVYYAPPPRVYYAPPPPVYYAPPPPVYSPPGVSLGVTIPIR